MWYLDEARCLQELGRHQLEVLMYLLAQIDAEDYCFKAKVARAPESRFVQGREEYRVQSVASVLSDLHMQIDWHDKQESLFLYEIKQIYQGLCQMDYRALTLGYDPKDHCAQLIPCFAGSHDVDLLQKVARIYYFLLDEHIASKTFAKSNKADFQRLQHMITHAVSTPDMELFDYDYRFSNVSATSHYVMQSLLNELIAEGYLFELENGGKQKIAINELLLQRGHQSHRAKSVEEVSDPRERPVPDHCVFCDAQVLERQFFKEEQDFYILFNYLPYTWPHFMLIPKQHQENLFLCEDQWLVDVGNYLLDFVTKLERYYGVPFVIFNQNGSHAGQTQPHSHIHILPKPNKLAFKIRIASMIYQADPNMNFLSEIGMANTRGQVDKILRR